MTIKIFFVILAVLSFLFGVKLSESKEKVALSLSGIVTAEKRTAQGILIKSTSLVWNEVAHALGNDWSRAFEIPPEKWEEIVAGAFHKAGFDQVKPLAGKRFPSPDATLASLGRISC